MSRDQRNEGVYNYASAEPVVGQPLHKSVQSAVDKMKSETYANAFGTAQPVNGDALFQGLSDIFNQQEIPLGLMNKLLNLDGYSMHFKIDDSGSMTSSSSLPRKNASSYMQGVGDTRKEMLTRWEEAENRLHILFDLISFVPTGSITLSFLNRREMIILDRAQKSPEEFAAYAHDKIKATFGTRPAGETPIHRNMQNMLQQALPNQNARTTMHYLLTDGEPSGGEEEIRNIKELLKKRNAQCNPFTFLCCSNDPGHTDWMHELEEVAPSVAALRNFLAEKDEVLKDQGSAFRYTYGFWLLANIAAAVNPNDLDAMDQHAPLTKLTIENLYGREITEAEYRRYFDKHPNANRVFGPDYELFLTCEIARQIPSVAYFDRVLAQLLENDIDKGEDDTDETEERAAEQSVIDARRRGEFSRVKAGMFGNTQQSSYVPIPNYDSAAANTGDQSVACACTMV